MSHWRHRCLKFSLGEGGAVVVITLLIVTVLALLGVTFLTIALTETSISFNEDRLSQAFHLADAGLAEAIRTLRDSSNWNTQLTATQPFPCPTSLVSALNAPFAGDGCSFRIQNDAADTGGATNDTNNLVIVRSTGQYQNSTREVNAAITRVAIASPPGAITSVGIASNIAFNGNSFTIDGNNWIPPSGSTPASQDNSACGSVSVPKFGIAVPTVVQQLEAKNDLNSQQQDNVTGAPPNPPWVPASDYPSIGVDTTVTQAQIESLADLLIPLADITYTPGTRITSQTIGTQTSPKIVAVDATGSSSNPALDLNAVTGYGVLIVKNGDLRIRGNSQWVGFVIVVGSNVSIDVRGGGHKQIYGSVFLAEATDVSSNAAEGDGTVDIRFSCDGVNVANNAGGGKLRGATLWWKEVF